MANVEHDPQVEEIVTSEAVTLPKYVACNPLAEAESVDVIVVPDIVTVPLFAAQIPFAPFAAVVTFPSVIVTSPPWTKIAAFTP